MKLRTGIIVGLFVLGLGGAYLLQSAWLNEPEWTIQQWQAGDDPAAIPNPPSLGKSREEILFNGLKIRWAYQVVNGIEVAGSFLKVSEKDGRVGYAESRFIPADRLPTPEAVDRQLREADAAEITASIGQVTKGCRSRSPTRNLLDFERGKWRVLYRTDCETPGGTLKLVFNTRGTVVERGPVAAMFEWQNPPVVLYPMGPVKSALTEVRVPVSAKPFYLLTPDLQVTSDAGLSLADIGEISSVTPADPRFDMVQAYYYSTKALAWTEKTVGIKIQGLKIRTHVGYPEKRNVAFYYNKEVRIGAGDDIVFSHMAWDPTIVVHEAMHAVVEALTHLPFEGEGGSLSEAMADTLTALHLQTPNMGEASYRSGPYQRTLTGGKHFDEKAGKLYHDSLILSGTVWNIREDAGDEVALDLTRFLLERLTPATNFESAREHVRAWFQACSEGERCDRIGSILNRRGWL